MRVGDPRGRVGQEFPEGWLREKHQLLKAVLGENRRYLKIYKEQVLNMMQLRRIGNNWECHEELRQTTGGL